ncbi:MAG: anthranilate phosphoribosyltransferase [Candidatus Omnitrophota bacterium]|nr:anthranilate phosphoribosyltransferase [Candidatus Omnitrophota bacterium]
MIKEVIAEVVKGIDLSCLEAEQVMKEIMDGEATPSQIASFITALRIKGETVDEITGCARIMRQYAKKIKVTGAAVDTCGTGGDKSYTFNISTVSAFVVSAAGLTVAKHGNVSVSSKCGSANLLEALGVKIYISPDKVEQCLAKIGIGFLFAPALHQAMKYAMPSRREIGIRTVFNILGPLTNPAGANCQLLGVYKRELTEPLARVLANLGSDHALVVHGLDGLDEVTITSQTQVSELVNGEVRTYLIGPEDFGIKKADSKDLKGGEIQVNLRIAREVLGGQPGPQRDIVLLNAGCAIYAADLTKDINQGIKLAQKSIDSGSALKKLELLKKYTNN